MLVATAGHIDHGKTALVRAITGVETDRLPEERARGISIDLGFAYWRPDAGPTIGFIDVPGHERYVRNTIAGIAGARFALLTVAADDGVMPQTREHLAMLDLLGFDRGLVAITKADRVGAERIATMHGELQALLRHSSLAGVPIHVVSALSGAGIGELKAALIAAREASAREPPMEGAGFRLAIDRAFSVPGAGTVVTGTVLAGTARVGERLMLSPAGRVVRVRGLQSGGHEADAVAPGERAALNLAGIELGELGRGDWLVEPALHAPTQRIEALVRVTRATPLRHDARVHLHLGTADLVARVLVPAQRAIDAGESAVAQLVLAEPTAAVVGQRFILRDGAGRMLVGGGQVLDPLASPNRRAWPLRQAAAGALALPDPGEAIAALAAIPGHEVSVAWFGVAYGLQGETAQLMIADAGLVRLGKDGGILMSPDRLALLEAALEAALAGHHRDTPTSAGMSRRAARVALGEPVSAALFAALVGRLVTTARIESAGAVLRLPGHSPPFNPAEMALWSDLRRLCEDEKPRPLVLAELVRELGVNEAAMRAMLHRRLASGDIWQVSERRYLLDEHVAALVATAARLDAAGDGFTAAQYRDATGLGRNFVIELLEFFDRIGATRRLGDRRRMRADYFAMAEPPGDSALARERIGQ